jgi:hypothetical protein
MDSGSKDALDLLLLLHSNLATLMFWYIRQADQNETISVGV